MPQKIGDREIRSHIAEMGRRTSPSHTVARLPRFVPADGAKTRARRVAFAKTHARNVARWVLYGVLCKEEESQGKGKGKGYRDLEEEEGRLETETREVHEFKVSYANCMAWGFNTSPWTRPENVVPRCLWEWEGGVYKEEGVRVGWDWVRGEKGEWRGEGEEEDEELAPEEDEVGHVAESFMRAHEGDVVVKDGRRCSLTALCLRMCEGS